jgi:hypothetical protein
MSGPTIDKESGRSRRRVEDSRFLTGRGQYVDDLHRPRELHGYVLRAPCGHATFAVRVRPETSSRITKFSEHEADGCEAQERERIVVEIFPVLGKPATAVEPADCSLDDPALWQNDKALGSIATTHDLGYQPKKSMQNARNSRPMQYPKSCPQPSIWYW